MRKREKKIPKGTKRKKRVAKRNGEKKEREGERLRTLEHQKESFKEWIEKVTDTGFRGGAILAII